MDNKESNTLRWIKRHERLMFKPKVECSCGAVIHKSKHAKHLRTEKHQKDLEKKKHFVSLMQ